MIGVLVIRVPLRSHSIDVPRAHKVFFEEDDKKKILISHLFRKKVKFQIFSCLKFYFKIPKF